MQLTPFRSVGTIEEIIETSQKIAVKLSVTSVVNQVVLNTGRPRQPLNLHS